MPSFNALCFAVTLALSHAAIGHFIMAVRAEHSLHHRKYAVISAIVASLALFFALRGAP